jgi:hypothetical protein
MDRGYNAFGTALVLRVDDSEETWSVRLPEGITAGCERVVIKPLIHAHLR